MNSLFPSTPHDKSKANAEHVVRLARQLADGNRPGVLSTVDAQGAPHIRWMATLSLQDFPHLYALTSPQSRKVQHIRDCPKVNWMFTTDSTSMVVNLQGSATILTEQGDVNRIWRMIDNKSNAYFLGLDPEAEGVVVIDTLIEDIECVVPRYDLHYPMKTGGPFTQNDGQ